MFGKNKQVIINVIIKKNKIEIIIIINNQILIELEILKIFKFTLITIIVFIINPNYHKLLV